MVLRRREINKDVVQQSAEAITSTAQRLAVIVLGATRQVITEVGDLATELFEIGDAAGRARRDASAARGSQQTPDA
ncbi:hypothetical protein [Mumia quercus]|uniref:hypothetical protein n=1 Tax=Mumia quercus TaxID=2976125 RepID=UPI0021D00BC8|nr:hypothetical protein [Mumia quercus]